MWLRLGLIAAVCLILSRSGLTDFLAGRLVCGALLLHLLPGVAAAHLFRRQDRLETIILGLALSPLVVTLLFYLLSHFLGLPPWAATGIILLATLAGLVRHNSEPAGSSMKLAAALPLGAGLLLVLLTVLHYSQASSNMLNLHGLFHTSGIQQIMAGLIPPDNLHLYGIASGYQWPAWIVPAASSMVMEISPPLAAAISRCLIFFGLLGLGVLLARDLDQKPAGTAFSGMLVFLGMNLFGGLFYLYRAATSPEVRQALLSGAFLAGLEGNFLPDAISMHIRVRTGSIIIKLVKFSFIIPGYVAVLVAILGALRVFQGKRRGGFLLIFLGAATALLVHPILAVILALPMPLALLLAQFNRPRGERFPLARLAGVAGCLTLAALPVLSYLLPGMEAAGGGGVTSRVNRGVALTMAWLYLPLVPAALPAAIRAFRRRDRHNSFIALLAVIFAIFILTQQVKCDWYHLYLLSIPLGLLAGGELGRWYHRLPGRVPRGLFAGILVLLILLGPCLRLQLFSRIRRPDIGRYRFAAASHITLEQRDSDRARAYEWIRRETLPGAVLVEKPKKRNLEELSALTGRRVFVGRRTPHTPWPRGDWRPLEDAQDLVGRLLEPGSEKGAALTHLAGLPDPVYLVLSRKDTASRMELLAAEYEALPQALCLEFQRPTVKIYRVLPR